MPINNNNGFILVDSKTQMIGATYGVYTSEVNHLNNNLIFYIVLGFSE